jgi:ABC-type phosphate transport system auxiliary subunit
MSPFIVPVMALMIPIVAILFAGFKSWLKLKERQLEATNTLTAEKTAQYAAHTERLEQRVRVLSDEIEALRDPAPRLKADLD